MELFRLLIESQNFDRPSVEIALDLIYASTGYRGQKYYIEFGLPEFCDPRPDIDYDANTFVPAEVNTQYDARFIGRNGFLYHRLSLDKITISQPLRLWPTSYPFKPVDVLAQINQQLVTQMQESDLLDVEYTEPGDFKLFAGPHSLVWTGSKDFIAMPAGEPQYLFPVQKLTGFTEVPSI